MTALFAGNDGVLSALEVSGLDLRGTKLVVLSACETALGVRANSEGVAGLRQAFQSAGAEAVVATLWPVNDRASAEFVKRFYGFLASGVTATDALRFAQLDAMQRGVAPRDWAAFVLTGDGFVRVGAGATASR